MKSNFGTVIEVLDMALDSAQLISILPRLFNKKKDPDEEKQKQILKLLESGKIKDANEEVIHSWITGLTGADEIRLLGDVCVLIQEGTISVDEAYTFFSFLEHSSVVLRTRFRDAYIAERNPEKRKSIVTTISKLPDDEHRTTFMVGDGLTDATLWEQAIQALRGPLRRFGDLARGKIAEQEERRAQRLANPAPPPNRSWFQSMIRFKIFD
jgi:hypothetical protein